jgi:integrase
MAKVRKRTWRNAKGERSAWVADYFDANGKRHIKTFERKREADAWLVKARGEIAKGIHTPDSTSITVAEAGTLWLERGRAEGLERATLREYTRYVGRYLVPRIGNERLARLSTPGIEMFRDHLLKTASRLTSRNVLLALKGVLKEAQRRGLVAQNAAQPVRVDLKKRERGKLAIGRDIPSKEEARAILEHAGPRWRPIILTATFTGLRASELRGLAWGDVDLAGKVLYVRRRADFEGTIGRPKSAAGARAVPLAPIVVNTLREWQLACPPGPADFVFPNGAGNVEYHGNLTTRGFYAAQQAAGVVNADGKPKYGFHSLRHFCASTWIELGFSPKRLQAMLGHSSITMTFDVYGHLFPSTEDDQPKLAAGQLAILGG